LTTNNGAGRNLEADLKCAHLALRGPRNHFNLQREVGQFLATSFALWAATPHRREIPFQFNFQHALIRSQDDGVDGARLDIAAFPCAGPRGQEVTIGAFVVGFLILRFIVPTAKGKSSALSG